jgi:DNA-binding FrmR family transcriptional regulator
MQPFVLHDVSITNELSELFGSAYRSGSPHTIDHRSHWLSDRRVVSQIRILPLIALYSMGVSVEPLEVWMPYGYSDNKGAIQKRLRRVEGQVRGLQRMVDEDRYCINILEQVSAATRALQSVALELLDSHLDHCVADAVRDGGDEATAKLKEASAAIARLVRS